MREVIAVPTQSNMVDSHFGHCEFYTLFTIHNNVIEKKEKLASLPGCGCKSNIIPILREKGVSIMLAGNMGEGALYNLQMNGINVFRGCSGDVDQLVDIYLAGSIRDSGETCIHHHEEGHQCSHE